jgi:DNA-binding NarL/FixJ family response regulator
MSPSHATVAVEGRKRIRILLADDHAYMLRSLRQFLELDFDIVAAVNDGAALEEAAYALKPELIVTDISMPKKSGLDAAKAIIREQPGVGLIFLTVHNDPELARSAFEIGARGYVLKGHASIELNDAIERVLNGLTYLSPSVQGGGG